MTHLRKTLLLFSALGVLQHAPMLPASGAEQAIRKQSDCTRIGGNLRPSGQRQLKDPLAYYDIAERKCTACDMDLDLFC